MRDLIKRILNPETQLRVRLFQLLSIIALAEFVVVSIYTMVTGGSAGHIALMLCGTVAFAVTVALTFKTHQMRVGAAVSGLLYFALYPLTFFSSGGIYGGAPIVFAFALVYVFLVTQKWERIALMALSVAASGVCFLVAYRNPDLLTKHTVPAEYTESFLSLLLVTLLLCALFTFVTEVYQAENRIVRRQKKEIEDLNQAQKRFFSSMSHEIRTPVNAIIGLNEMTLREAASDEVRENARNIEVASKFLLHAVNEILDMSRIETDSIQLIPGDYATTGMLSEIVGMCWALAQQKGLEFAVRVDPAVPRTLNGDEMRIKQILLNVVTNAIKYTRTGTVTLSVSGSTDPNGAFRSIYEVTDTGIGIREENIPRLFTAYQRMDEQQNRAIEGTGLGLFIVKQLLDRMNGDISVKSVYGSGSTFRIEIPQTVVDPAPVGGVDLRKHAAPQVQYQSAVLAPGRRVLAVDDTPMNLMVVKKLLRETKLQVDTAPGGAEALELTRTTHYDVILMDHQMPGMDGIECLRRIRSQENGQCRDSKIVCLTANVGVEMETLYREAGFDGYLVKPVKGRQLEEELARLLPEKA